MSSALRSFSGDFSQPAPFPEKAEYHPIRENIHLLNDNTGFCRFDGMKFDWLLKEQDKAVAIMPGKDDVALRIQDSDHPRAYPIDRTFSCGIVTLPVRPMQKKEPGMRTCYPLRYAKRMPPASPHA